MSDLMTMSDLITELNRAALNFAAADPKPWWQSATIWGGLAVVASQGAALVGYQLDAVPLSGVLTDLAGLVGGAVVIWGRLRAIQPVKL